MKDRLQEIKRKRSISIDFGAVGIPESEYVTAADVDWLISQLEAMRAELREDLEFLNIGQWDGYQLDGNGSYCNSCGAYLRHGHTPDCAIAARISAIRKVVGDE